MKRYKGWYVPENVKTGKEITLLEMYKHGKKVAEFDITNSDYNEIVELTEIQKTLDRRCSVKRVFVGEV